MSVFQNGVCGVCRGVFVFEMTCFHNGSDLREVCSFMCGFVGRLVRVRPVVGVCVSVCAFGTLHVSNL